MPSAPKPRHPRHFRLEIEGLSRGSHGDGHLPHRLHAGRFSITKTLPLRHRCEFANPISGLTPAAPTLMREEDFPFSWSLPPPSSKPSDLSPAQFLATRPVFRLEELKAWYAQTGRATSSAADMIRWHVKRGRYLHLENSVYVHADFLEPHAIASRLADDAVISLISALAVRDLAGSPYQTTFFTQKRVAVVRYADRVFRPLRADPYPGHRELETVTRDGVEMKVTALERTFIDCFARPQYAPEPEELITAFRQTHASLDVDACIETARVTGSRHVMSRLHFALICTPVRLNGEQIRALKNHGLRKPDYFSRAHRTGFDCFDTHSKLIVPLSLLAMRVTPNP